MYGCQLARIMNSARRSFLTNQQKHCSTKIVGALLGWNIQFENKHF